MKKQGPSKKCRKNGSVTIKSGERLTIENAADFATSIREALAASQKVIIEFDVNVEADITALQVLCSACKTAAAEGKPLTRQGDDSESLRQLIISAGAKRLGPCSHNNGNTCIWFGGTQS